MFAIEVKDNGVHVVLADLAKRTSNMQPVMQSLGEDIMARAKARFGTSTGPDGVVWAANMPSTIARKGTGKPPLVGDSGSLRQQFHVSASGSQVTISNSMIYAAIQQFGGAIQRPAYSKQVRHRTDAKGNLLTTKDFHGKGLIFAKDSHKQALTRWFEVNAHAINIPARPFLPIRNNGFLYAEEQSKILATLNQYIAGGK